MTFTLTYEMLKIGGVCIGIFILVVIGIFCRRYLKKRSSLNSVLFETQSSDFEKVNGL